MDESSSGDEIFLTQNIFRGNCANIDTQDASKAVEFFGEDYWKDVDDHSFPEDVTYWDFTHEVDNSSVAPSTQQFIENRIQTSNQNFNSVVTEDYFADDEAVSIDYKIFLSMSICC